ncbi:GNAT family N-acetyltransferase [Nakamurella flavida]|uniref:GNAT family N-acetyltransferase n=1 Tax=Nakamurella flavida TaxID=363630 RepID=A0A938YKG0_9ACTN|nr:GNAT family N-acetyltransferase [Nakamurella flavida]MBM9477622.1 GNAT family N-acetyltransferase [Nakamurella flavida]MDP9779171.1 GNAT superfamily N-acetyltransferase [Nakamurella flavida]
MSVTRVPVACIAVPWDDPRAEALRVAMTAELDIRYPEMAARPADDPLKATLTVDGADVITTILAVLPDGTAVGHGALRRLQIHGRPEVEIKRVIVHAEHRGKRVAAAVMTALEEAARATGAPRVVLHTGDRQPEAVALYRSLGYRSIPLYPPYDRTMPQSFCFAKELAQPGPS